MATTEALSTNVSDVADFEYRAISSGAIAAVVLGLLSSLTFIAGNDSLQACLMMCPIPIAGLTMGLRAMAKIRSMPDQLSGARLALAGVLLSIVGLVGGLGYSYHVYATEAPDGYTRTSFAAFRPDQVEVRRGTLVPADVRQLDGEKVFLKGYMRADSTRVRQNIDRFLLVRDNNQCCFGDINNVKFYDQVLVKMAGPLRADYSAGLLRLGGTLHVSPENARLGIGHPVYTLDADYLQ